MKIVLDGMGGDNAPRSIVEGAFMAINEYKDIEIIITGDKEKIEKELDDFKCDKSKISIVHTSQVIENEDKPVTAIRSKKDSSMVVALNLVKNKEADVIISAGSTGALLSGGIFILKRIKGISRPCICTCMPTITGGVTLLSDTGANVDCSVENLKDFAVMTDIYARNVLKIENPRVALANNGTEEGKGNSLVKDTYEELKNMPALNFIGNMEPREVLNGVCDIIICDGFVGNMILKTLEGTAISLFKVLKEAMMSSTKSKIGALMMKKDLYKVKSLLDYKEVGGSPFLGIEGGMIKAHGSSDARAIKNAIRQGIALQKGQVVENIKAYIENK
ncbi:phosphate acyltransferase PlsX [Peptostreptococcus equinus]|uniref:Phosphate acyltransferase n=1 Tax=Peptostreptococcus equinus TaxID=3003601 RepID=A0ABY7JMY7_9FIRM|nr:phosphate acyltransferase PlsX [Peptostreptococcus sp. CBA3647]WAW14211.1 phosphate acyltransferase PlsX [Peptostreptococcus sp. CBA3647]